ncbi:unnamed protein product [Polarella glacialis]|uniref:Nascent polypeptide-associated complex subunit beta n=1 Tax=Polarella glacialis TaxID=89957 RepID=A0A813KT12_POLGL|nr:unnamed protein product [Polarella glacialis]
MDQSSEVLAARAKLAQRFDAVRTGGKGTMRRTKIAKHAHSGADDKQMQAQLKKLGVNAIPGIEEVNFFMESGSVLHFAAPKVQAAVASNTFVINGKGEEKRLEELLPGIISQLGPDNLMNLKRIAEGYAAAQGAASKEGEDIPDIGENFEDVSKVASSWRELLDSYMDEQITNYSSHCLQDAFSMYHLMRLCGYEWEHEQRSRPTFLALLRPLCIHDNVRNEADHGRDAGAGAAGSAIDGMTRAKDVADQVAVHVQRSHVAKHVSKGKCCKVRFTCLGKLQEYNPSLSHEVACRHTSAMNEDECRITRSFCFPFSPRLY